MFSIQIIPFICQKVKLSPVLAGFLPFAAAAQMAEKAKQTDRSVDVLVGAGLRSVEVLG
jgi:hypothetical protein